MREDPDVILVGEMRDAETISMAMTAAETGHLVLGTLHTTGAVKTIDRIIDALPIEEREQTKSFLSQSLLAVVTQVLVKTGDGQGRKAICEVMVMTKAIAKLIQTDQTHQIPSQLQMGREFGMQLLDQALLAAVQAREIDPDDAYGLRHRQTRPAEIRDRHFPGTQARRCRRAGQWRCRPGRHAGRRQVVPWPRSIAICMKYCNGAARTCTSSPATRHESACMATSTPLRPELLTADFVRQLLLRDHAGQGPVDALRGTRRRGLRLHAGGSGSLPRQRAAPAQRHGRGIPRHSIQGADHGRVETARRPCARWRAPTMA